MCKGTGCPKKLSCYRYLATPDRYMQSFFTDVPYDHETNKCEHFWLADGLTRKLAKIKTKDSGRSQNDKEREEE